MSRSRSRRGTIVIGDRPERRGQDDVALGADGTAAVAEATSPISAFAVESRSTVEQRVARGLILVPERRELFAAMSVADNLELGGFQRARSGERGWRATLDEVYARFPRLGERREQLAGTLSGGERQMLAMGRALMGKPKLLMLDEPSLGLAPLMVREIFNIVVGSARGRRGDPAGRAERAGGAAGLRLRLCARNGRARARRAERRPRRESARRGDVSRQARGVVGRPTPCRPDGATAAATAFRDRSRGVKPRRLRRPGTRRRSP